MYSLFCSVCPSDHHRDSGTQPEEYPFHRPFASSRPVSDRIGSVLLYSVRDRAPVRRIRPPLVYFPDMAEAAHPAPDVPVPVGPVTVPHAASSAARMTAIITEIIFFIAFLLTADRTDIRAPCAAECCGCPSGSGMHRKSANTAPECRHIRH